MTLQKKKSEKTKGREEAKEGGNLARRRRESQKTTDYAEKKRKEIRSYRRPGPKIISRGSGYGVVIQPLLKNKTNEQ